MFNRRPPCKKIWEYLSCNQFAKMNTLQKICGKRKGTTLYVMCSKAYYVRQKREGVVYLVCQDHKKGCSASLKAEEKSDGTVSLLKPHNEHCTVSQASIDLITAKTEMKEQAEEGFAAGSSSSLKDVFNSTAEKHGGRLTSVL